MLSWAVLRSSVHCVYVLVVDLPTGFFCSAVFRGFAGNWEWSRRLKFEMFMGPAILSPIYSCKEWYAEGFLPWEHFVPVAANWSNLTDAMEWVLDHPNDTQAMVERRQQYACRMLTPMGLMQYLRQLLVGYAGLLTYNVTRDNTTIPFTTATRRLDLIRRPRKR